MMPIDASVRPSEKDTLMDRLTSLLILLLLTGCRTGVEFRTYPVNQPASNTASQTAPDTRANDFALWAARAENAYPRQAQAVAATDVAAVVDRDTGDIKLYNFSAQPLRDANVWINGQYGRPLDEVLPSNHGVTLQRGTFHNNYGISFGKDQSPATRIEVQKGNTLFRAQGPAIEAQP